MVKPEILAPCGTPEAFEAALIAGADAVYLAGDKFGARAYAGNFSKDVLLSTLERAHLFGVKVYLTVNTLLKNEELEELKEYLEAYYEAGLDAVLVQDFGVLSYIRKHFPNLPVHISTQMNVTSSEGALLMRELGAERVVLNREITMDEVKDIRDKVPVETEVFVHGAMCFSYSGRCLLSSYAGGRSGNRGRCAQPCRKLYKGKGGDGYIMSMKDMCTLRRIPELIEAGVDSLKIEGRMKNAAYVAAVVSAYKEVRDDYLSGRYDIKKVEALEEKLKEVFSRGEFTEGYIGLASRQPEEISKASLIFPGRQGHSGVSIGTVVSAGKGTVTINLNKDINVGDELIIEAGADIRLTSNISGKKGKNIVLNAPLTKNIKQGVEVRRLRNSVISEELELMLSKKRTVEVEGSVIIKTGKPVKLSYIYKTDAGEKIEAAVTGPEAETASKAPVSDETLIKALSRLGDTDFTLGERRIYNDGESFVPVSVLNSLRREAADALYNKIREWHKRSAEEDFQYVAESDVNGTEINATESSDDAVIIRFKVNGAVNDRQIKSLIKSPDCEDSIGTNVAAAGSEQMKAVIESLKSGSDSISVDSFFIDTGFGLSEREIKECIGIAEEEGVRTVLMLPHLYSLDRKFIYRDLMINHFREIYVRNVDDLAAVIHICRDERKHFDRIYLGASLYAYNNEAIGFLYELTKEYAGMIIFEAPCELNKKEAATLVYPSGTGEMRLLYGRTALMITAAYAQRHGMQEVTDDKINSFFIIPNEVLDYNTVLNGVPECLFAEKRNTANVLLSFTNESKDEVKKIIAEYVKGSDKPDFKYTRGHYYRGIE